MDHPQIDPPMPAHYYRRNAARVRKLASDATTPAVKQHLGRGGWTVAERVDRSTPPTEL